MTANLMEKENRVNERLRYFEMKDYIKAYPDADFEELSNVCCVPIKKVIEWTVFGLD